MRLIGIAIQRAVGIVTDEIVNWFPGSEEGKYNWGYMGEGPRNLAKAILEAHYPSKDTKPLVETLLRTIVVLLPQGNFNIDFDIDYWHELITQPTAAKKYPQELLFFYIENKRFSFFLYFIHTMYKNAEFSKMTKEYSLLSELTPEDYQALQKFTAIASSHFDKSGRLVETELIYNELNDTYEIANGMGEGFFKGTTITN